VEWVQLAKDTDRWRVLVNVVIKSVGSGVTELVSYIIFNYDFYYRPLFRIIFLGCRLRLCLDQFLGL
jgi:hypothetical protein